MKAHYSWANYMKQKERKRQRGRDNNDRKKYYCQLIQY